MWIEIVFENHRLKFGIFIKVQENPKNSLMFLQMPTLKYKHQLAVDK